MTRQDKNGKIWGPQERIDRQTMLKMVTRWAAEYVLKGNKLGSLEPGKIADLAVLDRDFMSIPEADISEIQPLLTLLGGEAVFIHPDFAKEQNFRPARAVVATYQELKARRNRWLGGSRGM